MSFFSIELIEVINPQVLKMTSTLEQVVADHEQRMTDCYDCSLAAPLWADSLEERSEVAAGRRTGHPLARASAGAIGFPFGSYAETLASAFIVSGADSRPGRPSG